MDNSVQNGRIMQINISKGGVPKNAVQEVEVTFDGLVGDQHNDRVSHGGPDQSVCLYSVELIQALQAEGHTIFPGAAGENVTLEGVAWEAIQPGRQLYLGSEVLLEITDYTTPCTKMVPYFKAGDFNRISQLKNPGWSRVYARVLSPGSLCTGQEVSLLNL